MTRFDLEAEDRSGISVLDFGAVVLEVRVPGRDGRVENVVLGHPSLADYERNAPYFGAIVGRCGGRIAGANFDLDGVSYRLAANDGRNHLHGGPGGFHLRSWQTEVHVRDHEGAEVLLSRTSPDGEEGYPGELEVEVRIGWNTQCEMRIVTTAVTSEPTPVNLVHHGYWNLAGEGSGSVDRHHLVVMADEYLPVESGLLPTGELAAVEGTPFDLRHGPRIGDVVRIDERQLQIAPGIDHTFVLGAPGEDGLSEAATLIDEQSGRRLHIRTNQPGLQVYTGNNLDGRVVGRSGRSYRQGDGVALEPQRFPDAVHHPHFPSVVLMPGERYRSESVFAFTVDS